MKSRRWFLWCFVKIQKRNLMILMKKHVFSMQIDWVLIWDFISEISSFLKFWVKMLDRKPKQVSEKQWKTVTFWASFGNKTLWGLCEIIAFDRMWDLKKSHFWWKRPKIDEKWVIFWAFLWDFAHKLQIHLFRSFSTFDLWHYRLYVWKPCVFHVFFVYFRAFGRLGLISDPGLELEGDYRGR